MNTFSKMWGHPHTGGSTEEDCGADCRTSYYRAEKSGGTGALTRRNRCLWEADKGIYRKQWGRDCKDLPAFIIKRLPLRFIYDNNYFNDRYQGIPIGGYTAIVEKMLDGIDVLLDTDYFTFVQEHADIAPKTVFTGMIDEFYGLSLACLSTGRFVLRQRSWIARTIREMQLSTIRIGRYRTPESLNTSILSSASSQQQ